MSSSVKNSNSDKPLNPFALSFKPEPKLYHQLPWELSPSPLLVQLQEVPAIPNFLYHHPSFVLSYSCEKQPHPLGKSLHTSKPIPYKGIGCGGSERRKWGFIPPRLLKSMPRERPHLHPVPKSERVWIRKSDHDQKYFKASSDDEFHGKTSLMIKNIPNHFGRVGLQRLLDRHCRTENRKARSGSKFCKSSYDFFYLPMDFGFHLNLGYAFVNFTSPVAALRFSRAFSNLEWSCRDGRIKTCEIGIAKLQGKDALKEHFEDSYFPCHSDDYLPVVFSPPRDGFNCTAPALIGRRTRATKTPKDRKVMIMTKRKNKIY